ncbi:hypothetical protein SDC9_109981 [bioreactor metagenome]|uniref:Uncharacterized protein n=1 Tax=bioreactor metagenome TaxID=1076179 RepID=A0A645BEL6_9ZZZZ
MVTKNVYAIGKQSSRNGFTSLRFKGLVVPLKMNCASFWDGNYGVFVDPVVSHFYLCEDGMNLPNGIIVSKIWPVVHGHASQNQCCVS